MEIKPLFPTLLGIVQADRDTIEAIGREVLQKRELLESLLSYSWGDNVMSSFEQERHLFARAELHALKKFVEDSILAFARETTGIADFAFDDSYTSSWVNITKKYGYQERHNHEVDAKGLPISGAYYFMTNGEDGNLDISPPDMLYKLYQSHSIKPAIGKLVLFRSEVFHRVSANHTDSDRISFSFNYLLRRQ